MTLTAATAAKIAGLRDPDPWLVEMARALAALMDSEPTAAVAKELRTVMTLLEAADSQPPESDLDRIFGASTATVGDTQDA